MDLNQHKERLYAWFNGLPKWARGTMVVGVSGITIYTIYSLVKAAKDRKQKQLAQAQLVQFVDDMDRLARQGVFPSFQESQYHIWTNAIVEQFAGCDPSFTNCPDMLRSIGYSKSGQTVFNIISGFQNDADFLALQAAWGIRTYDDCGWFTGNVTDVTLSAAISSELTNCEKEGLNKTLKNKGISYTF